MRILIQTTNSQLCSLLNKNPATDDGLYLKPSKNGHLIGNVISHNEYEVLFHDTKGSYSDYEANQIDFNSFCHPEIILNIVKEFFDEHLKEGFENKRISWLDSVVRNIDTKPCVITVDTVLITSGWIRNGEFLLSRYIPNIEVEEVASNVYKLKISCDNVRDAINLLTLVGFFITITNDDNYFIHPDTVEKYTRVFSNCKNIPYFVYYLYIKRIGRKSSNFRYVAETLSEHYYKMYGKDAYFTPNDTHTDRIEFVKSHLDYTRPILNYGCGEFRYERSMSKNLRKLMVSYDIEDFSKLHEKFSQRYPFSWSFYTDIEEIPAHYEYDIILSEVIEHTTKSHAKSIIEDIISRFNFNKIIITTPNSSFNKYYMLTDELRRDDHIFEFTYEEFHEFMDQFKNKVNIKYFQVGDCIDSDCVTSGCIITKKTKWQKIKEFFKVF